MILRKIKHEFTRNLFPINESEFEHLIQKAWRSKSLALSEITKYMKKSRVYLEYGMGFSTVLANKYIIKKERQIFSVESDRHFLRACRNYIKSQTKYNIDFIYADIGLTTDYGYPLFGYKKRHFGFSFLGNKDKWRSYSMHGWNKIKSKKLTPDLFFIDGRFRVACVLTSLINLPDDSECIIILDDYRDHYKIIEPFISKIKIIENTLFFKKGKCDIRNLEKLCIKYQCDPR